MRWAALLRAINAGVSLPMADLRAFLSAQGMRDVRTLLASGNAVFDCEVEDGLALAARLRAAAREVLGVDTGWFLRSHADLAAIIAANPFPDAAAERPNHLFVHVHDQPIDPEIPARVAAIYDGPERIHVVGRELFADYPQGVGQSGLPDALRKAKVPAEGTARNWNTLRKLLAATER